MPDQGTAPAKSTETHESVLAQDPCEQLTSPETGSSFISGETFKNKEVTFAVVGDLAVFEGDIILGSTAEMEENRRNKGAATEFGIALTGSGFRWSNCVVPFAISASLPNQNRVIDAIQHWEDRTPIIFNPRISTTRLL